MVDSIMFNGKAVKSSASIPFYSQAYNHGSFTIPKKKLYRKVFNYTCSRVAFNFPIKSIRILLHKWRGVSIGEYVYIGRKVTIDNAYPEYVYIGNYAGVNQGATILAHTNTMSHFEGVVASQVSPVIIEDYALVSINATVLPGVKIGHSAIVSAGSVVSKDVKSYTLSNGTKRRRDFNFESLLFNKK